LEPGTNIRVAVIINTPPDVGLDVNCIYRFLPIYGRSQTPFSELADAPLDGEGPPNEATIKQALRWRAMLFHSARHSAATLLLSRGVHPKIVSEMLGHSTVAITLDVYSYVAPAMHHEAASVMDQLLAD